MNKTRSPTIRTLINSLKTIIIELKAQINERYSQIYRQAILINALIKQKIDLENENIGLKSLNRELENKNIGLNSRQTGDERRRNKKKYKSD